MIRFHYRELVISKYTELNRYVGIYSIIITNGTCQLLTVIPSYSTFVSGSNTLLWCSGLFLSRFAAIGKHLLQEKRWRLWPAHPPKSCICDSCGNSCRGTSLQPAVLNQYQWRLGLEEKLLSPSSAPDPSILSHCPCITHSSVNPNGATGRHSQRVWQTQRQSYREACSERVTFAKKAKNLNSNRQSRCDRLEH